MKKKLCMLLLAAALAVSAGACGDKKEDTDASQEENPTEQSEGEAKSTESEADNISYEVSDSVKLGEYKGLKLTVTGTYEVTDEQVETYADNMAQYYSSPTYKETDKEVVESGDTVNIDYVGKKDGVAFDGGTASGYNLTIGSGSFIDGFEDGLIGKKVGETVDLNLTFPENYQSTELAGQDVVFTVTINKIMEEDASSQDAGLTDEFVSQNFGVDTVEEYKKMIREYLETSNASAKSSATRQAAIDKLEENCEVTIPDGLTEARVNDFITVFTNNNCKDTTLEDYLSDNYSGMSVEEFRTNLTGEMEENLKTELILEAIAKEEGIELDEDEYKKYVEQQMSADSLKSEEDYYLSIGVDAASGEASARKVFLCNQAMDFVIDNATVTYKESEEKAE